MVKIFLTGGTGYIGGDVLYALVNALPEAEITCLVRTTAKGATIAKTYASVKLVYGDLDSRELIETETAAADIVVHTANADHEGAVRAMVEGLQSKSSGGYILHTSGTGILADWDRETLKLGPENDKIYDDWDGVGEVVNLPDSRPHRNIDKIVLGARNEAKGVRTAIVSPPCIYGEGRGPDSTRSVQGPNLARETLKRGGIGVQASEGKASWNTVHIRDLSNVYVALVRKAIEEKSGGEAWKEPAYYFAENGEVLWGSASESIAKEAKTQGFATSAESSQVSVENLSPQQMNDTIPAGFMLYGVNSQSRSLRAGKLLGWKPSGKTFMEELPNLVHKEAVSLGLVKTHAEKAAGLA